MTFAVTINIKASRRAHTAEEGEKEEPFHALLARPARRRDVDGRTSLLCRWPVGPTSSSPFYHGAYKNPRIYPLRSYQSEERDRERDFDFFFYTAKSARRRRRRRARWGRRNPCRRPPYTNSPSRSGDLPPISSSAAGLRDGFLLIFFSRFLFSFLIVFFWAGLQRQGGEPGDVQGEGANRRQRRLQMVYTSPSRSCPHHGRG